MADYFTEREKIEAEYAATNTVIADYISRQAAIDAIRNQERHDIEHDFDFNNGLIVAMNAVDEVTAADVQPERCEDCVNFSKTRLLIPPVRHGHWIADNYFSMKCDQCGYSIPDWRWVESKYCPNCGARMDGE